MTLREFIAHVLADPKTNINGDITLHGYSDRCGNWEEELDGDRIEVTESGEIRLDVR